MIESLPVKHHFKTLSGNTYGFTIIEILLALVIIGILAAISIPVYNSHIDKAKITVSINTLEIVRKAIDDYYMGNNVYPPALDITTGEDGNGKIVLNSGVLTEFKKTLFSLESYSSPSTASYTLTARSMDSLHTLLVLSSEHGITKGP